MWNVLVVLFNIIAVLAVQAFLFFIWIYYFQKFIEKNNKRVIATIMAKHHIPNNYNENEIIDELYNYYSSELFSNRCSDLINTAISSLSWVVSILLLILFLGAIYIMFYNYEHATEALMILWIFVVFDLIKYFVVLILYALTSLLTNRSPGEAKFARKYIETLRQQNLTIN